MDIQFLIKPYSPWVNDETGLAWQEFRKIIPSFHRPVFRDLAQDLDAINQIISVTGPRRVGKTTLLRQLVRHLIDEKNVPPSRVIYYSFDDPARFRKSTSGGEIIESLMQHVCRSGQSGRSYLLLDEVQTLERWEQYLKKYYDLGYPVRMVISGSASSPIFKKSRESLLGRVKDYHILPFSFREFLLHRLDDSNKTSEINAVAARGEALMGMFARDPSRINTKSISVSMLSEELWDDAEEALKTYLVEGGFPEVWVLPTAEKKMEYLFDNQVNKVITEDLVLAVEFRKPEQLKTFYVSLLEQPGREVSLTRLSQELGIGYQQIDKYLPLLEMTDLIRHAGKFRSSPVRVRRGNQKFYLVDLALRNAVLRVGDELLTDESMLGLYAENLVFNALCKWRGVLQIDYYREGPREVDFIVHTNPSRYWPIEVKYQHDIRGADLKGIRRFRDKYPCHIPALVTKNRSDFGLRETEPAGEVFWFPLLLFLLLFD